MTAAVPALAHTCSRRLASVAGSQLRRNTVAGIVMAVGNVLVSALAYRLYLEQLGYEQYGVWLSVAVVLNAAQFGNLGLAPAVTKSVAHEHGKGNPGGIQSYVSTAVIAVGATGVIFAGIVVLFGRSITTLLKLSGPSAAQALHLMPFVAVLSVYILQVEAVNAALLGIGRLDLAMFAQFGSRLLTLVTASLLLTFGYGLPSLPAADCLGYVGLHAATVLLLRKRIGMNPIRLSAFDKKCFRQLMSFGVRVFSASALSFLLGPFNKVMLARCSGAGAVPVYELAYAVGMNLRSCLETGLRAIMPEVSRLSATESRTGVGRIAAIHRRALVFVGSVGVVIFGFVMLIAEPLLRVWLAERFRPELVPCARVLLAGAFISLIGVPSYYTLLGAGRLGSITGSHSIQAGANIAIASLGAWVFPFTPLLAACATAAAMFASTAYLLRSITMRHSAPESCRSRTL
ncbi:MAG TPA: oligosaccharide flippase family protein [Bryobacteraceae bacterium]|nr:oligosaccharide flippase family protein [Bryobacteraceae bacterium]